MLQHLVYRSPELGDWIAGIDRSGVQVYDIAHNKTPPDPVSVTFFEPGENYNGIAEPNIKQSFPSLNDGLSIEYTVFSHPRLGTHLNWDTLVIT